MKYLSIFNISLLILMFSCNNNDTPTAEFNGITETNFLGNQIGAVDESDWQQKDIWTQKELDLFSEFSHLNLNNDGISNSSDGGVWIAFPNPAVTIMDIRTWDLNNLEFGKLIIVNSHYQVIGQHSFDDNFFVKIDWKDPSSNFVPGIYRAYYVYKFLDQDYIFKGHGDLLNEPG